MFGHGVVPWVGIVGKATQRYCRSVYIRVAISSCFNRFIFVAKLGEGTMLETRQYGGLTSHMTYIGLHNYWLNTKASNIVLGVPGSNRGNDVKNPKYFTQPAEVRHPCFIIMDYRFWI